jgi:hypothetical protein
MKPRGPRKMAEEGGLTCPVAIEFALDAVTLA